MLQVRPDQMKVFEAAALRRFEDEMVVHSREFTPRLCEVLGDDQLRVALRQAMTRAARHGFTYRGPVRLYIDMVFLCGSDFDTDPQFPAAAKILKSPGDQMQRAEELHAGVLDYQEKVSGPEAVHTRQALANLLAMTRNPVTFTSEDFVPAMRREMHRVFSRRAAYIGDEGLTALIQEGRAEAREHRFSPVRAEALLVTLMFAFGHGCPADPLYPWIERTLEDERIVDAAARAERLERKAVTWLEHALASPREGART